MYLIYMYIYVYMYVYLQSYTYTLEHLRWCTAQDLGKLGMLETQIGKLLKGITPVLPEAELITGSTKL